MINDLQAFAYLQHAHQVAIIAIAARADGHIEFHPVINIIGLAFAQIPSTAGSTQARPAEAPSHGLFRAHHANINGALLEDAVFCEQAFQILEEIRKFLCPDSNSVFKPRRQILRNATRAEVIRVVMAARDRFVKLKQSLALLKAPKRRRDGTAIERIGGDVQQMVQHARQFAE